MGAFPHSTNVAINLIVFTIGGIMSTTMCDLASKLPLLIGQLLDRERHLKRGRFREETMTDIFMGALAAFAGPSLVIQYPLEVETGSDIDLRFWHAASGRNLFVRIQAKRLNAESDVGKTKTVKIKNRAYNELLHKAPKAPDYQFRILRDAPYPWIPLYMFYNHHGVTRDRAFAGTMPAVRGINLAFAHDIADELEQKLAAAPRKRLDYKRLSHLQKHFFGIEAILCPAGDWKGEAVPPPDLVAQSLKEWYRRDAAGSEAKDLRDAIFRRFMEPGGLIRSPDVARLLPDGPSIRVRQHDVDVPTITFISGRTTDERTPRITNDPDGPQG